MHAVGTIYDELLKIPTSVDKSGAVDLQCIYNVHRQV